MRYRPTANLTIAQLRAVRFDSVENSLQVIQISNTSTKSVNDFR